MRVITGRAAVLAAAANHPFARIRATGNDLVGYADRDVLLWTSVKRGGRAIASLGAPDACAALASVLLTAGHLPGASTVELPRITAEAAHRHLPNVELIDWSVLWTSSPPPSGSATGERLTAADDATIDALLQEALPDTDNRPGKASIRAWWGLRSGGELVAVAGDRSANGVGYLVGVAVSPAHQGRGLGSGLVGSVAARLVDEFGICALGVLARNTRGDAVFTRAGFIGRVDLTFARLAET